MWMQSEEDEDEDFAALMEQLAAESLPSKEAEVPMRSEADATPYKTMEMRYPEGTTLDDVLNPKPRPDARKTMEMRYPDGTTLDDVLNPKSKTLQESVESGEIRLLSDAPARDPFGLTEDDDPGLAEFVAQEQLGERPTFEPIYTNPANHPVSREADTSRAGIEDPERTLYPTEAPSDMAAGFYGRLARDSALAGDSESFDFASDRAKAYAATPPGATSVGGSPMWEKYASQGAHMGSGAGLSALASRGGGGYGGPPQAQDNSLMLGLAALADFGLNKGKNTGRLLGAAAAQDADYENYRRGMEHQKDLAGLQALSRRGAAGYGRGMDPLNYELRRRALELRERGLETTEAREARLKAQYRDKWDPGSEMSARARETAVRDFGMSPEFVQGKSQGEIAQNNPAFNEYLKQTGSIGEARTERAAATAGATSRAQIAPHVAQAEQIAAATHPYKMEQIREGQRIRNEGELQSPAHQMARDKMAADQAHAFTNATERYLNVADNIAPVREYLEKYKGQDNPTFGMDDSMKPDWWLGAQSGDEALRARQQLRNAGEQMLRANTGAAAPVTEEEANAVRTGLQDGATEQQVRIATEIVEKFARNNIRSFATNREGPARAVLRNRGLEQWAYPETAQPESAGLTQTTTVGSGDSLGVTTGAPPKVNTVVGTEAPPRPAPRKRSSGSQKAEAQSAPSIGSRNGKPVRRIEKATAPDGKRVRVVFYMDGSREVVP